MPSFAAVSLRPGQTKRIAKDADDTQRESSGGLQEATSSTPQGTIFKGWLAPWTALGCRFGFALASRSTATALFETLPHPLHRAPPCDHTGGIRPSMANCAIWGGSEHRNRGLVGENIPVKGGVIESVEIIRPWQGDVSWTASIIPISLSRERGEGGRRRESGGQSVGLLLERSLRPVPL